MWTCRLDVIPPTIVRASFVPLSVMSLYLVTLHLLSGHISRPVRRMVPNGQQIGENCRDIGSRGTVTCAFLSAKATMDVHHVDQQLHLLGIERQLYNCWNQWSSASSTSCVFGERSATLIRHSSLRCPRPNWPRMALEERRSVMARRYGRAR